MIGHNGVDMAFPVKTKIDREEIILRFPSYSDARKLSPDPRNVTPRGDGHSRIISPIFGKPVLQQDPDPFHWYYFT